MPSRKRTDAGVFVSRRHDHGHCIADALEAARALCTARAARLTPLRRQVLELVWAHHRPVRAYDILDRLRAASGRAAPPTVYRALDFLLEHGLVHRIESLNAYVGCPKPGERHSGQFLICSGCRAVAELDDRRLGAEVERSAHRAGFRVRRQMVELEGLCPDCAPAVPG